MRKPCLQKSTLPLQDSSSRRTRVITTAAEQPKAPCKLFYAVSGAPQHDRQPHPETAKRIPAVLSALEHAGVTSQQHADKAGSLSYQAQSAVLMLF